MDACNPLTGECVHAPNDALCDDQLFCNGVETCRPDHPDAYGMSGCVPGVEPDCSGSDVGECVRGRCNVTSDQCDAVPHDALCDDGHSCTADSCLADGACAHVANDTHCDDNVCVRVPPPQRRR